MSHDEMGMGLELVCVVHVQGVRVRISFTASSPCL